MPERREHPTPDPGDGELGRLRSAVCSEWYLVGGQLIRDPSSRRLPSISALVRKAFDLLLDTGWQPSVRDGVEADVLLARVFQHETDLLNHLGEEAPRVRVEDRGAGIQQIEPRSGLESTLEVVDLPHPNLDPDGSEVGLDHVRGIGAPVAAPLGSL